MVIGLDVVSGARTSLGQRWTSGQVDVSGGRLRVWAGPEVAGDLWAGFHILRHYVARQPLAIEDTSSGSETKGLTLLYYRPLA